MISRETQCLCGLPAPCLLFELYRPRRFTGQIIEYPVNPPHFIMILLITLLSTSYGISAASAVMKSIVFTALSATHNHKFSHLP